ncbi:MAG: hypothetical protein U9N53_08305 [Bacteroidota bacterium]|nr:hypothetical protein [Bacteroidota bacterium]
MNISEQLTYRKIFLFWSPLALTWLMMAFEQPLLIAFIARLSDAKYNLAAFGIAASFALIIEAPVIMLMSASTALVKDRNSYKKLKRFTDILNISVTLVQLIILIPPVFKLIVEDLMGIPSNIAHLSHVSLILLIPWAASIGYRRFFQGILIRNNLTRRVTYGTLVRLSVIVIVGFILYLTGVEGAYVGAAALSLAVLFEAVATRLMAWKIVRSIHQKADATKLVTDDNSANSQLTFRYITKFYTPLALTSILSLGVHPFVTFFLGKSYMAVESLAVLPVVSSLVFVFRSMGLSYQEVTIALIGENKQNYKMLKNFATILGIAVSVGIVLIAFTPLASFWLRKVSGLTLELANLSYLPLKIMIFLPAMTVLLNFQRSTLVIVGKTGPISTATALELVTIVAVLLLCVVYLNLIGVVAASIAFIIGKGIANTYLIRSQISTTREWGGQVKE